MEKYYDVVIVGGGIAGLATALGLKRVGIRAMVLERSHELRATGAALSLSPNAWRALDALGVAHKLIPLYPAFTQGYVTDLGSGKVVPITLGGKRDGEGLEVRSVHRKALLEALAQELPPETILFSSKLASITTKLHQDSTLAVLHMVDGTIINAKCKEVHYACFFSTKAVRDFLFTKTNVPNFKVTILLVAGIEFKVTILLVAGIEFKVTILLVAGIEFKGWLVDLGWCT